MDRAQAFEGTIYRTVDGLDLAAHVFRPRSQEARSAAVFFHGGGLTGGSPDQFHPECEYLASRGMVAASVAYRLLPNQASEVLECVADAQAAIAWARTTAGVDGGRVVACGYSAGGLLAGSTAFVKPREGVSPATRPDALVLLNAVVDASWTEAAGSEVALPPTLILHGRRDTIAPFSRARGLAAAMGAAGRHCELVEFDGAHTFFRPHAANGSAGFIGVLRNVDRFLIDLGYLSPDEGSSERIEAIGEAMLADVLARRAKRSQGH